MKQCNENLNSDENRDILQPYFFWMPTSPHQSDYNYLNYSLLFQEVLKQFLTSLSNLILDSISNDCLFCYVHFCNSLGIYNNEDFFPPNVRLTHVAIVTWFNSSIGYLPFWRFETSRHFSLYFSNYCGGKIWLSKN